MKGTIMTSTWGKPVAKQFVINGLSTVGKGMESFQSYDSVIVERTYTSGGVLTKLDETYWNYSTTTSKYRNQFLGETTKQTQAKIDSGEYILTDLN